MCCSALGQILFGVIMAIALGLTVASMFSDSWRDFKNDVSNDVNNLKVPDSQGLFQFTCKMPGDVDNGLTNSDYCKNWWKNLKTWEKVTVAAMCLALIIEVVALIWNFFTCFACCCKKYVIHPLSLFATLATICLAIAVIVYAANNGDALKDFEKNVQDGIKWNPPKSTVGYSFYMAVGALVCSAVSIIVAGLTVWFADRCL